MQLQKLKYNKSRKNKRKKSRRYKQKNKSRKMYRGGTNEYYLLTTLNDNDQFDTYIISKENASNYLFEDNSDIMKTTDVNKIEYYYKDTRHDYTGSERTYKPEIINIIGLGYGYKIDFDTYTTPFTFDQDTEISFTSNKIKYRSKEDIFFIVWVWIADRDIKNIGNTKLVRYYMKYSNIDKIQKLNYFETIKDTEDEDNFIKTISFNNSNRVISNFYKRIKRIKEKQINIVNDPDMKKKTNEYYIEFDH